MGGCLSRCMAVARGLLLPVLLCLTSGAMAQLRPDTALCFGRTIEGGRVKPEDFNLDAIIAACTREISSPLVTDKKRSEPLSARGNWLRIKKNYDGSITDYTDAIRLQPDVAVLYYGRALVWALKGDYDRAIADVDEDIKLSPADVVAYDTRGGLWRREGDLVRAIADYKKALSLNPKYVLAANNLAWVLATAPDEKFRDGKLAIAYATTACEASEWKYANALGTLAAAYAEAGDFDKAVQWQEKALKDDTYVKYAGEKAIARVALYKQRQAYRE